MNRNRMPRMVFEAGLLFCLVLSIISGLALQAEKKQPAIGRELVRPAPIKLPDLQVEQISLTKDCELQVAIANIGLAGVPDASYLGKTAVGIHLFNGHVPGPAISLRVFDPKGKLKVPGGKATHVYPGAIASSSGLTPPNIKVVIDPKNVLKEANETNNELAQKVICKAKASIEIYAVDPPQPEDMCWYRGEQNTYGILWKTFNYAYPTIQKITLTCLENWDQDPYVPCHIVTTIGVNAPNTGKFFFKLPPASVHTGRYEIRIYGNGGIVSNVFAHCIW